MPIDFKEVLKGIVLMNLGKFSQEARNKLNSMLNSLLLQQPSVEAASIFAFLTTAMLLDLEEGIVKQSASVEVTWNDIRVYCEKLQNGIKQYSIKDHNIISMFGHFWYDKTIPAPVLGVDIMTTTNILKITEEVLKIA